MFLFNYDKLFNNIRLRVRNSTIVSGRKFDHFSGKNMQAHKLTTSSFLSFYWLEKDRITFFRPETILFLHRMVLNCKAFIILCFLNASLWCCFCLLFHLYKSIFFLNKIKIINSNNSSCTSWHQRLKIHYVLWLKMIRNVLSAGLFGV